MWDITIIFNTNLPTIRFAVGGLTNLDHHIGMMTAFDETIIERIEIERLNK